MSPLPLHCEASFLPDFLSPDEADALFTELVTGHHVTNKIMKMPDGTDYETGLGTYFFMDLELTPLDIFPEAWGGRSPWPDSLLRVRNRIAELTGVHFQVARGVYYADGSDAMDFHTDPPAYGSTDQIASLSLGAERPFSFRSIANPDDILTFPLPGGSLLLMGKGCQELYEHGLPADPTCTSPRLNLTFRRYGWD